MSGPQGSRPRRRAGFLFRLLAWVAHAPNWILKTYFSEIYLQYFWQFAVFVVLSLLSELYTYPYSSLACALAPADREQPLENRTPFISRGVRSTAPERSVGCRCNQLLHWLNPTACLCAMFAGDENSCVHCVGKKNVAAPQYRVKFLCKGKWGLAIISYLFLYEGCPYIGNFINTELLSFKTNHWDPPLLCNCTGGSPRQSEGTELLFSPLPVPFNYFSVRHQFRVQKRNHLNKKLWVFRRQISWHIPLTSLEPNYQQSTCTCFCCIPYQ